MISAYGKMLNFMICDMLIMKVYIIPRECKESVCSHNEISRYFQGR